LEECLKNYHYETAPEVCSSAIDLSLSDDGKTVVKVKFQGGCSGSLAAVSVLAAGKSTDEVIELLENVKCGKKNTSCPAQLAVMLKKIANM
jgi:uncharacterized protein (TIGR03905 family)